MMVMAHDLQTLCNLPLQLEGICPSAAGGAMSGWRCRRSARPAAPSPTGDRTAP